MKQNPSQWNNQLSTRGGIFFILEFVSIISVKCDSLIGLFNLSMDRSHFENYGNIHPLSLFQKLTKL